MDLGTSLILLYITSTIFFFLLIIGILSLITSAFVHCKSKTHTDTHKIQETSFSIEAEKWSPEETI